MRISPLHSSKNSNKCSLPRRTLRFSFRLLFNRQTFDLMRSLVELDQGPMRNAPAVEADITLSIQSPGLFRNCLAWDRLIGVGVCHLRAPGFGTRHDLKTRVEVDHGRGKLFQDARVALHLRGAIRN